MPWFRARKRDGAEQRRERVMFMHIPKTAGSSVNAFAVQELGAQACAEHIESQPGWRGGPDDLLPFLSKSYISGHIRFMEWARKLDLSHYLTTVTLREPFAHLASHIAWTRRLAQPGNEPMLARHTPEIQMVANRLSSLDLRNPKTIGRWIEEMSVHERYLFDNHQVRFFADVPAERAVDGFDLQLASNMLDVFDVVGLAEKLSLFLGRVAEEMNWARPSGEIRENQFPERFGLEVENADVRTALMPLVRHDVDLYQRAKAGKLRDEQVLRN